MDCSPPGSSSIRAILQAGILEWVVIPFSRGSSWPRDGTHVSCIAGGFLTNGASGKANTEVWPTFNTTLSYSQFVYTWIKKKIECHLLGSLRSLSSCRLVPKSCPTLLRPGGLWLARLLYPRDLPGKNTGRDCHFLLHQTPQSPQQVITTIYIYIHIPGGFPAGSGVKSLPEVQVTQPQFLSWKDSLEKETAKIKPRSFLKRQFHHVLSQWQPAVFKPWKKKKLGAYKFFFMNIGENIHLTTNNINIDIWVPISVSGHETFNLHVPNVLH